MSTWLWLLAGLAAWMAVSGVFGVVLGRWLHVRDLPQAQAVARAEQRTTVEA